MIDSEADQSRPMGTSRGQKGGEEVGLKVLRPSARAAIPSVFYWVGLACVITWGLFRFDSQVTWVASLVAQLMGDTFPYGSWFYWLLGGVWISCAMPPAYRLLVLKTTEYEFTSQRLRYTRGILNRQRDQLELVRVRDLTAYRPLLQRLLGIGTLRMETVDRSHPTFTLEAQRDVYGLKDWIHELNARERARLGYREYEGTQGIG